MTTAKCDGQPAVLIDGEVARKIRQHARSCSKTEVCGVLIGTDHDGTTVIDLVRSEGMTDWVPVSQVIGTIAVPVSAPVSANAGPAVIYPDPPSLQWGIALLLGVITCGIFGWIWALIQASFVKKLFPRPRRCSITLFRSLFLLPQSSRGASFENSGEDEGNP